ncbi:hypothetical protein MAE02_30720 [Microvirga aerophila]|uniref:ATPase BadF/BadG/BcrA/BcrD type domain-containing protein n=1 Tax=Microvirga aerophila TaxID=670291 RepID=A0A512BTR0_9HYPH|nr:hypothetical protein MAE02_30720 [Microvirga aerophila]
MTGPRAVFLKDCPGFGRILLMTDGYAALIGAGGGRPCGLVVAGTGAVGHRLYTDGRSIRRDGWGWVAGDRGSGVWIGRKALRHSIEVYDGLAPTDRLADYVLEKLQSDGGVQHGLLGIRPHQVASFAPFVFTAAAEGEAAALSIIDRAISHLTGLVRLLDLEDDTPLYISGGLGRLLRSGLSMRMQRDLLVPDSDPIHGCYLVATGRAPIEDVTLTAFKRGGC